MAYNSLGFVGGAIFGLTYAPITMTGMHSQLIATETQLSRQCSYRRKLYLLCS